MIWSVTMAILDVFCDMANCEVEEKMATMEISISKSTIIHTTLSPSRLSKKFQKVVFFFSSAISLNIAKLKHSHSLFELTSPVLIACEQVKTSAAGAKEHDVSRLGELFGLFHGVAR